MKKSLFLVFFMTLVIGCAGLLRSEEPTKARDPKIPLAQGEVADPGQVKKAPAVPPEYVDPVEVVGLPKVLIIGDSISIAYTLIVRREVDGVANVYRIKANGGATKTALGSYGLCRWIEDGEKWDVIFFNHGVHDASYRFEDGNDKDKDGNYASPARGCKPYVSVDEYEQNLHAIVAVLRKTGAKLVFGTTTPIPNSLAEKYVENSELPYNEVAKKVMKEERVSVVDLWAAVKPEQDKLQISRNVHFQKEGSEVLGRQVATAIRSVIETK